MTSLPPPPPTPEEENIVVSDEVDHTLHWDPKIERYGLGNLLKKVNHIAILVKDVGTSLAWYVNVLGLQQIRRPNFDRHGAWLTMGNVELHLIKGVPTVHQGDDLIVGHISVETDHVDLVLERLKALKIPFKQNISVPDPKKSRENKFEGEHTTKPTGVVQYFLTDPDGYYIEICNCDILTKFCLNKEDAPTDILYEDCSLPLSVAMKALSWKRKALKNITKAAHRLEEETPVATEVDQERLTNLLRRRNTYGDIVQGFSELEITDALLKSDNNVGLAIKKLKEIRGTELYLQPPAYISSEGVLVKPDAILSTRRET